MSTVCQKKRVVVWGLCGVLVVGVMGSKAAALPPDPDNAALLYYRAFILCPSSDKQIEDLLFKVMHGAGPNEEVRGWRIVDGTRKQQVLKLAEAAGHLPQCQWGIYYSQGEGLWLGWDKAIRSLIMLLCVDARILASDGDYEAALRRGLTLHRLARHFGDESLALCVYSRLAECWALTSIHQVLSAMPPDANALTWLKDQLRSTQGPALSFTRALETEHELELQRLRDPNVLVNFRDDIRANLEATAADGRAKKEIRDLTDAELITRIRKPYDEILSSFIRVLDRDESLEKKAAEIKDLSERGKKLMTPFDIHITSDFGGVFSGAYMGMLSNTSHLNALMVAIETYLVKAKTGQLSDTLTAGVAKDPYSGQEFQYEKTKDGFLLRCRAKDQVSGKVQQYEFKVKK